MVHSIMMPSILSIQLIALMISSFTCASTRPVTEGETDAEERIIGGSPVKSSEFPYLATIYKTMQDEISLCAGAIIAADWIITAAHCLLTQGIVDPSVKTEVAIGVDNLALFARKRVEVKELFLPERAAAGFNDIALIKLATNLTFDKGLARLSLPAAYEDKKYIEKKNAVRIAGFGATKENGTVQNELRGVSLTLLDDSKCWPTEGFDSQRHLCAGTDDGSKDACVGDSGGPLVAQDKLIILGIVSYGHGCSRPGSPGVYTRVSYHLWWIKKIMSSNAS